MIQCTRESEAVTRSRLADFSDEEDEIVHKSASPGGCKGQFLKEKTAASC